MENQDCKLQHYRISYKQLCFAVSVKNGWIQTAAPVARWMLGQRWYGLEKYWLNRGAEITQLNINTHATHSKIQNKAGETPADVHGIK